MNKFLAKKVREVIASGNDIEIIKFAISLEGEDGKTIDKLAQAVADNGNAGNIYRFATNVPNAPIAILAKAICKACNFVYLQLFAKDVLDMTAEEFIDIYYDDPENEGEESYIC